MIWNNSPLCDGSDRVPSPSEDLRQLLCNITASETKDGERQSETFVYEHCVRRAVRVSHNVRRASRRVQTQDSLDRHVHGEHVERPSRRAAGDAAVMAGACDLQGRPLRCAPRSPRYERGNTHLSNSAFVHINVHVVPLARLVLLRVCRVFACHCHSLFLRTSCTAYRTDSSFTFRAFGLLTPSA